jgi:hypothetical protein
MRGIEVSGRFGSELFETSGAAEVERFVIMEVRILRGFGIDRHPAHDVSSGTVCGRACEALGSVRVHRVVMFLLVGHQRSLNFECSRSPSPEKMHTQLRPPRLRRLVE